MATIKMTFDKLGPVSREYVATLKAGVTIKDLVSAALKMYHPKATATEINDVVLDIAQFDQASYKDVHFAICQ